MWNRFTQSLSEEQRDEVVASAVKRLEGISLAEIRDRNRLTSKAQTAVQKTLSALDGSAPPSVNAKLPRHSLAPDFGGARVKILHPVVAPGDGFPSINIRLFEPRPVSPEQIVAWGEAPEAVVHGLAAAVSRGLRPPLVGGAAPGKTAR